MLEQGHHMIDIGDVELSIEIAGAGPPLLLVTPGWGVGIEGYRHLAPLQDRFTVVWTETRGTGRSSAPSDGSYTLSAFTRDHEALREALGLDRWWLAGHSWGGVQMQDYLAHHPDRCDGALLLCTLLADDDPMEEAAARALARAEEPGVAEAIEAFQVAPTDDEAGLEQLGRMLPLYFADHAASERFAAATSDLTRRMAPMAATTDPANRDRSALEGLRAVDVPVVIVAAEQDFICAPPFGQRVHHAIPGSKLVLIENAGHFPWFEQPDQFWDGLESASAGLGV